MSCHFRDHAKIKGGHRIAESDVFLWAWDIKTKTVYRQELLKVDGSWLASYR
jgi:hypothetical protein